MTDQLHAYMALGKEFSSHDSVNHGCKEYARGKAHVNTAESFNAILERAKQGVFHFISRQHLPRYLSEVTFRWKQSCSRGKEAKRIVKDRDASKAGAGSTFRLASACSWYAAPKNHQGRSCSASAFVLWIEPLFLVFEEWR